MNISIFGLGYVGIVSAACLADQGHHVIGVDIQPEKVTVIQQGHSPIVEPGLAELIEQCVNSGHLRATTDITEAISDTDLSIICVGTPSQNNGALDLSYVERVCQQVGVGIRDKDAYHSVVLRSTVLPGTMEELVIPTLEASSGKRIGQGFGVAFNPEFLREGSAIADFNHPPKTVIGEVDQLTSDKLVQIYHFLDAPLNRVPLRVAEAVKYADNAFHALKVAFANEIGALCKAYDIDSHQVMDIFVQDTKLNLSPYYLKPGDAFGGSCLPKDVRALIYALNKQDVKAPVLSSILPSNELQKQRVFDVVAQNGSKNIGVLGLSFKENTDDLRESPTINLVERLIGKGYQVKIYDPILNTSKLIGSNRDFMESYLPHIDRLLVDTLADLLAVSDTIVVTRRDKYLEEIKEKLTEHHQVVDLVRLPDEFQSHFEGRYNGIAW